MCPRRRFYKSPVTNVDAGKKERVLFCRGNFCVKQLTLQYDGHDTTSSNKNKWIIKIDGQEVFSFTPYDICYFFCGFMTTNDSDRPIITLKYDTDYNIYRFIFHDLGVVNEGIEIWLENIDTSNSCDVKVGMVYDVLE